MDRRGTTNWDRGFGTAAAANTPTNNFDVAVIITDGNPTSYNQPAQGNGSTNRFRETENGIFSANALKAGPGGAAPTRILAFGVGDGATGAANASEPAGDLGPDALQRHQRSGGRLLPDGRLLERRQRRCATSPSATARARSRSRSRSFRTRRRPARSPVRFRQVRAGSSTVSSNTAGVTTPTASQTTTADGTGTVNYPLDLHGRRHQRHP